MTRLMLVAVVMLGLGGCRDMSDLESGDASQIDASINDWIGTYELRWEQPCAPSWVGRCPVFLGANYATISVSAAGGWTIQMEPTVPIEEMSPELFTVGEVITDEDRSLPWSAQRTGPDEWTATLWVTMLAYDWLQPQINTVTATKITPE